MAKYKRRIKLIQPRLQLKLILCFLGVSALSLALQFILFTTTLTSVAADLPQDGSYLLEHVPDYVSWILVVSCAVLLPLTFCVGVLVTFRVAGPLHRFEMFLKAIAAGQKPADCRIRKTDDLQDFCRLLNEATAPLRRSAESVDARAPRSLDKAA